MRLTKNNLKLAGLCLYKCEGTRSRMDNRGGRVYAVEFTNKEPIVIKVFMRFLREILNAEEERIKGELFIYEDLNKEDLERYWSKVSGIPLTRFNKTMVLRQKNVKYRPNPLGTFKIRYTHKDHFLQLEKWIESIFKTD